MRALIRADLRNRWRSLAALAGGCFVLLIALSGTYSAYGGAAGFANTFGAGRTPKLFSAFSGSSTGDVFTPPHFLAFGFGHPLFLVLALSVAITSGVAAIATDVETGRSELIFTAPVRPTQVLGARIAEWALAELGVITVALVGALIGMQLSSDLSQVSAAVPLRASVQFISLAFFVAGVAFAASAHARSRGAAFGATVGVTAGSYVVNLVGLLWSPLSFVRWINPFGYYAPIDAAQRLQWGNEAALLAAGTLLFGLAARRVGRRDLA
ncbi:MAG TPA: ABC transporter permease subunit [Mycobacteriales bacterium]|nr:ABC transporter permease subunit [Mycobacteriales bacterium]